MNVPARDRDLLRWASILHDIGKLRVSPAILNKPGKPTDEEWALLRAHPMHGAQIASALLPWLGEWGDVIVQHHERYDGTGYPHGLAGRDISLGGRIVAVADAYEVMTATRAYRRPISRVAAHRELVKWSGRQFDPVVVRAMVGLSAPRLRRAQGVLAWLSDVPMVASSYVPAATLARVVGAGALATGAATGVGLPSAVFSAAGVPSGEVSAASVGAVGVGNPTGSTNAGVTESGADSAGTPSNQADQSTDLDAVAGAPVAGGIVDTAPAPGEKAAETVAPTVADPTPAKSSSSPAAAPSAASPSAESPSVAAPGTASSGTPSSSSAPPKSSSATNPSGRASIPRNSTVAGTVAATVSAVTSTVTAVTGTVTAVTGTVDTTVGALTGALGGAGGAGSAAGPGSTVGTTVGSTVGGVTSTATGTVTGVLNGVGGLLGGGKKKK
jgi:HD domain